MGHPVAEIRTTQIRSLEPSIMKYLGLVKYMKTWIPLHSRFTSQTVSLQNGWTFDSKLSLLANMINKRNSETNFLFQAFFSVVCCLYKSTL